MVKPRQADGQLWMWVKIKAVLVVVGRLGIDGHRVQRRPADQVVWSGEDGGVVVGQR